MKKFNKGFTLAELLITLAIIGVVMALTIPAVIESTSKQKYHIGLKKLLYELNSSVNTASNEDGISPSVTDITDSNSLADFFGNYLHRLKTTNATMWLTDGTKLQFVYGHSGAGSGCRAIADPSAFNPADNCYVIVDVNGDKSPNYITSGSLTADIYVLGISPVAVLSVTPTSNITVDGSAGFAGLSGSSVSINGGATGTISSGNNASLEAVTRE